MTNSTLIVIDMQEGSYNAQNPYVINEVLNLIEQSILNGDGIVIVQYKGFGQTIQSIVDLIHHHEYDRIDYIWKYTDDGSVEIYDSIIENDFGYETIKVCGVNIEACVKETVCSLSHEFPYSKLEVIESACGGYDFDFNWIYNLHNNNGELI